jgi:WD40 repeat protein
VILCSSYDGSLIHSCEFGGVTPCYHIRSIYFNNNDSRIVLLSYGGALREWDATTFDLLTESPDVDDALDCDISTDSCRMVCSHRDGSMSIRNVNDTIPYCKITDLKFYDVTMNADGSRIATVHNEPRKIVVWDALLGVQMCSYRGHSGDIFLLCFNADSSKIASRGFDDAVIRVWDANTGDDLYTAPATNIQAMCFGGEVSGYVLK